MRAKPALLAALCLLALAGCDALGADAVGAAPEPLKIPPPRAEKARRSVDQALDLYPSLEIASRDPFLTAAEQHALQTGDPMREVVPTAAPVEKRKNLAGLEAIQGDVSFIVFGTNAGRRTAVWRGRTLQEGQQVGDFLVTSIDEDGIRLREKDGPETRYLKFRRQAADLWKTKN